MRRTSALGPASPVSGNTFCVDGGLVTINDSARADLLNTSDATVKLSAAKKLIFLNVGILFIISNSLNRSSNDGSYETHGPVDRQCRPLNFLSTSRPQFYRADRTADRKFDSAPAWAPRGWGGRGGGGAFRVRSLLCVSPVSHLKHPLGPVRGVCKPRRPSPNRLQAI